MMKIVIDAILQAAIDPSSPIPVTDEHRRLALRLAPLKQAEELLRMRISLPEDETHVVVANSTEFAVRSAAGWKEAFLKLRGQRGDAGTKEELQSAGILEMCAKDMVTLWSDPIVKNIVRQKRLRLEESSGLWVPSLPSPSGLYLLTQFVLGHLTASYLTSHAWPLAITGPLTTTFSGPVSRRSGCKSTRSHWSTAQREGVCGIFLMLEAHDHNVLLGNPFLMTVRVAPPGVQNVPCQPLIFAHPVNAIIFLAPISAFDQSLAEDRRVNRVEDSLLLWKSICSSKLLRKVELILFLNKCDLLAKKLEAGIRLAKFVPSFKDYPNDWETVTKCT